MPHQYPVTSEAEAIEQAARLTQLDALTHRIRAQRVTVADEHTPFLWRQFTGRPAWQVEFSDVQLRFKSSMQNFKDNYRRTFVVLVDETAGRLISITSKFDGKDPDLRQQPSGQAAEVQLQAEDEIYHGLPAEGPRLTFLDALEVVLNKGMGSPFLAKEIYANYVVHSRGASPQRAVWVVTLNGVPPLPAHGTGGDQVPVWQRNHMRNVIDDETGTNLFATNSPQPR